MAERIREDLMDRLRMLAGRENRSIDAVLEELLAGYEATHPEPIDSDHDDDEIPPLGTLARLAYEAQRSGIATGHTDTSERSREILQNEYPEYLMKRMDRPATNEPNSD